MNESIQGTQILHHKLLMVMSFARADFKFQGHPIARFILNMIVGQSKRKKKITFM